MNDRDIRCVYITHFASASTDLAISASFSGGKGYPVRIWKRASCLSSTDRSKFEAFTNHFLRGLVPTDGT